jgi:hypothetical protein
LDVTYLGWDEKKWVRMMRILASKCYSTLKENKTILEALALACRCDLNDSQRRTLGSVKECFLDKNGDLPVSLWHQFLSMLDQLHVERPGVQLDARSSGQGAWYGIPAGKAGTAKLTRRASHRRIAWSAVLKEASLLPDDIDQALSARSKAPREPNWEVELLEGLKERLGTVERSVTELRRFLSQMNERKMILPSQVE